ncbi:MAG: putative glycoside hydrolase [Gemmatimonadaceae bacterium]|nr:putative glycoside hydrolase [Gemmatimonadaceae bacterium]
MSRVVFLVFSAALTAGACDQRTASADPRVAGPPVPERIGSAANDTISADTVPRVTHMPMPRIVRGLYVNRWAAVGAKMNQMIDLAKTTEINALVIDVKDDRGFVLYRSRVPLARQIGADTNSPMSAARVRAMLDSMRAHNIYAVARIVVVKDPLLADKKRELAIKRRSDMQPWLDKNGKPWLDPHQRAVWQYAVDLGKEAWELGFSEVQLDYVRFPDEQRLIRESVFPLAQGRLRAQVIRDQLGYARQQLRVSGIPMTIDVFGLTATDSTDMGVGQKWEMFVDMADAVLPMNYPSHFAPGTYKIPNPNARPYATIDNAMKDVRRRTAPVKGAGRIIPWYQDFTLGRPRYGVAEVRAQIQAGYDNGYYDWVLWNPGSRYTVAALRPKSALEEGLRSLTADSIRRAATARRADSVRRADSARRADSLRASPGQ